MTTAQESPDTAAPVGADAPAEELSLHEELSQAFEAEPTDEVKAPAEGEGRTRDELGRFAKGTEKPQDRLQQPDQGPATTPARRAAPGAPGAVTEPAPSPELKAPQSWTPAGRETWARIPPEAQAEIHRRESEMGRVLQEGAQNRQFIDAFTRIVSPYEVFIRSEGSNPLTAMASLFQTAAQFRVGTPETKAQLVAGLIQDYGIDINMLDGMMARKVTDGSFRPNQPQPLRDPRVDQLLAQQAQQREYMEQVETYQMRQGLDAFAAAPEHEFYRDVAATMADIVEVRARQGQPIDFEAIYRQACALDPEISTIVNQRAAAQRSPSQAVLRAKRAAVSVRNEATPSGATLPRDESVRAGIEAAIESLGRA